MYTAKIIDEGQNQWDHDGFRWTFFLEHPRDEQHKYGVGVPQHDCQTGINLANGDEIQQGHCCDTNSADEKHGDC
jgi:hypothetical protein